MRRVRFSDYITAHLLLENPRSYYNYFHILYNLISTDQIPSEISHSLIKLDFFLILTCQNVSNLPDENHERNPRVYLLYLLIYCSAELDMAALVVRHLDLFNYLASLPRRGPSLRPRLPKHQYGQPTATSAC